MSALSKYLERHKISRPEGKTFDQAGGLSEYISYQLVPSNLKHHLHRGNFDRWFRGVWKALNNAGYTKLIDIGIPRPPKDSPKAKLWSDTSSMVVKWLQDNITNVVLPEVEAGCWQSQFADEFMDFLIRRFSRRDPKQDIDAISHLMVTHRRDYNKTTKYLKAFLRSFNWLAQQMDGIIPYFAACIALVPLTDTGDDSELKVAIKNMGEMIYAHEGNDFFHFNVSDLNNAFLKTIAEISNEDDTEDDQ